MANYTSTTIYSLLQRLGQRTDGRATSYDTNQPHPYDNSFWTENEKLFALTEAIRFWQCLTGQWQEKFYLPIEGGTAFIDVPKQLASVYRVSLVTWGSSTTPLHLTSLYELDTSFGAWQATEGTPLYWAPCGANQFAVYPHLPDQGGVWGRRAFEIIGYRDIAHLDAGDYINIGNEELTYILDYARHYLAFKEGQGELDATLPGVERLVAAAAFKNSRLMATNTYKHYMGIDREEGQRPLANGETIGIRGLGQ